MHTWHARCVCSNERAVVLMMKGADPVYQLDLRADPPCIKSQRPGEHPSPCQLPTSLPCSCVMPYAVHISSPCQK